jgi:hypothetical protein
MQVALGNLHLKNNHFQFMNITKANERETFEALTIEKGRMTGNSIDTFTIFRQFNATSINNRN